MFKYLLFCVLAVFWASNMFAGIPEIKGETSSLYINFNNKVNLALNGADPLEIDFKITNGRFTKMDDSTYLVVPQFPADEFKIKLYYKKVICGIQTTKAVMVPKPDLYIEGVKEGKISKSSLMALKKLSLSTSEPMPDYLNYVFKSCNITVIDPNGIGVMNWNVHNDVLENHITDSFVKISKGAKLNFSNIYIMDGSNTLSRLDQALQIMVTD
ncbi:MAG: hypothetical protein H6567_12955 [Lewinellaceae bacterium]|nr:hypothetical protein [Lewinellaceae bacterium]